MANNGWINGGVDSKRISTNGRAEAQAGVQKKPATNLNRLKNQFKILIFSFFVPKCKHWRGRRNERAFTSLSLDFCYSEPAVISGIQTVGGIVSEYCENTTKTMHPVQLV